MRLYIWHSDDRIGIDHLCIAVFAATDDEARAIAEQSEHIRTDIHDEFSDHLPMLDDLDLTVHDSNVGFEVWSTYGINRLGGD